MTRTERKLFKDTAALGLALTLLVVVLDLAGWLHRLELGLYDLRARYCQFYTPPPTEKLIHVDIDDRSIEVIGHWPWPRSVLAEMVDEGRLAGAKAFATDIIFSEPKRFDLSDEQILAASRQGPAPATAPADALRQLQVTVPLVNNDLALADALRRFREAGGKPIIPVALNLNVPPNTSPPYRALLGLLRDELELPYDAAMARLRSQGFTPDQVARTAEHFGAALREVLFDRIEREARDGAASYDELRRRILGRSDEQIGSSPLLRTLREQYERYQAVQSLRRFSRPSMRDLPPLLASSQEHATLKVLTDSSHSTGFVDYVPMTDGVVRSVPLWANHRDHLFPQFSLALACAMLDAKLEDVRVSADRVVIPCPDGNGGTRAVSVPVRTQRSARGTFGLFFDIPWFGPPTESGWQVMYDYPRYADSARHLPAHALYEPTLLRRRVQENNRKAHEALVFLWSQLDSTQARAQQLADSPAFTDDADQYADLIEETRRELKRQDLVAFYSSFDPDDPDPEVRTKRSRMLSSSAAIEQLAVQLPRLKADLQGARARLRAQLEGKAALVGWIAVGAIADRVPTPLYPTCPGVVAHGAVFTALMTGQFWRRAPGWIGGAPTARVGVLATAAVARLAMVRALLATGLLAVGYTLFNGVFLFDFSNYIVPLAGPLIAAAAVFSLGSFLRAVLENNEVNRVTRSFGKYVDPQLVKTVLEGNAELKGRRKELTVVFTDLAGFTNLSEQLGPRIVPLLNDYFGRMVPVVRKNGGYLNKFIGDAMMFFYGDPVENAFHASKAVQTVLDMQHVMPAFNQSLVAQGLAPVSFRAGICSGPMIVGDAGSLNAERAEDKASDYTVLGDNVNLASRLEGANKFFGTHVLMNERTRELVADRFLVRPVGRMQVKGQSVGVMTYEPLALREAAAPDQIRLAQLTEDVVLPFLKGGFDQCLRAVEVFESELGPSKLTTLYRDLSAQYLKELPPPAFAGQITLAEK